MRAISLTFAVLFSVIFGAGCGMERTERLQKGGLTKKGYADLRAINEILSDNEAGIAMAFTPVSALGNSKPQELARAIKSGGCRAVSDQEPKGDFSADWSAAKIYEGAAACPIRLERTWRYFWRDRKLVTTHGFTALGTEYRALAGVGQLRGSGGLSVTRGRGDEFAITGRVVYERMEITGHGSLRAEVKGTALGGYLGVVLSRPGDWAASGGVSWAAEDSTRRTYFLEGVAVNRKSFL